MAPAHAVCSSIAPRCTEAAETQRRSGAESEDMSHQDAWGLSHPVLRPLRVSRSAVPHATSSAGADDSPLNNLSETFSSSGEDENCGSDGCVTPKAKRYRIPEMTSFPCAPRKPRATSRRRVKPTNFFSPPEFDHFLPFHRSSKLVGSLQV